MPFAGTPDIVEVTDTCYRITNVSLLAGASGTISFVQRQAAADVKLIAQNWDPYRNEETVTLQDLVQVWFNKVNRPFAESEPNQAILVTKTGETRANFLITLTNTGTLQSSNLEIYVQKP